MDELPRRLSVNLTVNPNSSPAELNGLENGVKDIDGTLFHFEQPNSFYN